MDKCIWKDCTFTPCAKHLEIIKNGGTFSYFNTGIKTYEAAYCPVCGADIRKPEPKILTERSGETWVAKCDGIEYLDISGDSEIYDIETMDHTNLSDKNWWRVISEIEITDEIAKLRPSITHIYSGENYILLGVIGTSVSVYSRKYEKLTTRDTYVIRLSSVSDLGEQCEQ